MPDRQRTVCEKCGKEYGIGDSPWCKDDHKPGTSNWHFAHNGQWTPSQQHLRDKAATDPFGI